MADTEQRIAANLRRLRDEIAAAALASGRPPADVRLVAVTKYASDAATAALADAGCLDLGESRPQDLWRKAALLADRPIRWHLIGHLQRNKVRRTLPRVSLFHAGDSWRLLEEFNAEAVRQQRRTPLLLEVNISGEAAKHGFRPDELPAVVARLGELPAIEVRGLMAMSGVDADSAATRRQFEAVRDLSQRLAADAPPSVELTELSLGMSGDFREAIAAGATLVRIGSALFEGLDEP